MYYFAAWTDSGFLLGCSHEHETIREADPCIPCAGGHVVAVGNGVMRSLTAAEEAEWQRVHYVPRTNDPAVPDEEVADDPRYAVMIRIRVDDRWTWTTWMCFETYAEALAHALARGQQGRAFSIPRICSITEADRIRLSARYESSARERTSAGRRRDVPRLRAPISDCIRLRSGV